MQYLRKLVFTIVTSSISLNAAIACTKYGIEDGKNGDLYIQQDDKTYLAFRVAQGPNSVDVDFGRKFSVLVAVKKLSENINEQSAIVIKSTRNTEGSQGGAALDVFTNRISIINIEENAERIRKLRVPFDKYQSLHLGNKVDRLTERRLKIDFHFNLLVSGVLRNSFEWRDFYVFSSANSAPNLIRSVANIRYSNIFDDLYCVR